nr:MAG TPA: hypothetical protein [Caudoviricetes sp.]
MKNYNQMKSSSNRLNMSTCTAISAVYVLSSTKS